jgi:hypothetical protein
MALYSCYGNSMICGDLSLFEFELHATARAGESSPVGSLPAGVCILTIHICGGIVVSVERWMIENNVMELWLVIMIAMST